MDTIASRLAAARLETGWSQEELAKRAGLSKGTVGNIEAGTRQGTARVIQALAATLEVNPTWLVNGTGPRKAGPPWPFGQVDRRSIEALSKAQLAAVEGAILLTLAQLGASSKDLAA